MTRNKQAKSMLNWLQSGITLCPWIYRKPSLNMSPWAPQNPVALIDPEDMQVDVPRELEDIEAAIDELEEMFQNLCKFSEDDDMAEALATSCIAKVKLVVKEIEIYIDENSGRF